MITITWTLADEDESSYVQNFEDNEPQKAAEFLMALKLSRSLTLVSISAQSADALKILDRVAAIQARLIEEIGYDDEGRR